MKAAAAPLVSREKPRTIYWSYGEPVDYEEAYDPPPLGIPTKAGLGIISSQC